MSFEEYSDAFIWRCDGGCGLAVEFPPRNFYAAKDELKARGWRITRDDEGEWIHRCAKCTKKNENAANVLDMPIKRKPGRPG